MLNFFRLALFTSLSLIHGVSSAAAFKCTGGDGKVSFSDLPCPASAVKDEKIMGRGAGYSHLTEDERRQFMAGVLSKCTAPRNVCECIGEYTADSLTYEEIIQSSKNPNKISSSIRETTVKAVKVCTAMNSKR
jgi:hypothetical protein